jgi:dTDP-4-amino-4,6-dideoxygalactose transaminase
MHTPDWLVPLADVRFSAAEVETVADVYRSGWLSQGPQVAEFERAFAELVGSPHALAVASGTAALQLGLAAAGIGRGDEVIVPSMTFAASAAAIVQSGATPVFADIAAPNRPWLSRETAQSAIGPLTRAIINVAYGGHPGDAMALRQLADSRGLLLIEDAAHAAGGEVDGRSTGTLGHVGAFSFFANKNLPLGEGGMLVTADEALAERARLLRSHGVSLGTWERHREGASEYDVLEPGFNFRLDEPRAALGRVLLRRLRSDNERRAALAARYGDLLSAVDGIDPVLVEAPRVRGAWHIYPVLIADQIDRRVLREGLVVAGVQTSIHYPALHLSTAFRATAGGLTLANTERYATRTLTLPLFPDMTEHQQNAVISSIIRLVSLDRVPSDG